jgi:tetratricopeptide (TPR) repeat protein
VAHFICCSNCLCCVENGIKPNYASAWYKKGAVLNALGRSEEAITSFEEAIRIKPDFASAWYNMACLNMLRGKIEKALSDLEKAIEIGGDIYINYAKVEEVFKYISNNPRFTQILSKGNTES